MLPTRMTRLTMGLLRMALRVLRGPARQVREVRVVEQGRRRGRRRKRRRRVSRR